ncbi:hypothetical protein FHT40_004815 [Mycolicibacterium sp. BK556]|uniref:hypothetical protein n=1 Tax=unclassified Mycolicibacterium TaxID=2636767 RepID=UPI001608CBF6|nr:MULTISPECIES: hypothetical protein [unclassified Mycolicibacterium]MBB3605131.1 hypothetical protein [Mycolicibacterium sp. BK556]MBB3635327.1 hypothetical protein [Mycolicibacterium sp. BK607]MBB3747879.1 hypothetical protein [Mycolicibacterium sp. BK634]
MRVQEIFGFSAIAALAAAAIFSSFPLWKSATVSPDAIQRRVWWTCCAIAAVSVLLWQLPNWGQGLFAAILLAVALFFVAGRWTTFIKINGRVFSASPRPDRPPALAPADDE